MKTRTRTTEVTVERSEVFVIRKPRKTISAWCEVCAARVRLVTPEEGALTTVQSAREIYRRTEAGQLHFAETTEGLLLVCLKSLEIMNESLAAFHPSS